MDEPKWDCPNGCTEHAHWITYEKGQYIYARPCEIHRPNWVHPQIRAEAEEARKREEEEAKHAARIRRAKGDMGAERERSDW